MKTPQERAAIYALIARMVSQQQDVLRSMMAQDLVRMLKLGIYADPDERGLHLEAARRGIAADGVMVDAPTAEQLLDGAQFVQHRGGGIYRTCAEWDAAGVFVPLAKWLALAKHLDGVRECPECGPVTRCHGASEAEPCPLGVKEGAKHTFTPSVPSVLPPMSEE